MRTCGTQLKYFLSIIILSIFVSCKTYRVAKNYSLLTEQCADSNILINAFNQNSPNYDGYWIVQYSEDDAAPVVGINQPDNVLILYLIEHDKLVFYRAFNATNLNMLEESTLESISNVTIASNLATYQDFVDELNRLFNKSYWYGTTKIYNLGRIETVIKNQSENVKSVENYNYFGTLKVKSKIYTNGNDTTYIYSKKDTIVKINPANKLLFEKSNQ